jgi:predicted regulator of Ras-like GTPase activity (Roadblock/LC7/MglB family)
MARKPRNDVYTLRGGLTIFPEHHQALELLLTNLVQKIPARFVLLCDVSGQLISSRGDTGRTNLVALGSLVAGDLAASQEIARLIGEYQDHQMILREGQTAHTFITEAGYYLALLVQVSSEVPLGWARMLTQEAARNLAEIMEQTPNEVKPTTPEPILAEDGLPDLFNDALDELWLE